MANIIIPYILPLLLGRTIDLTSYESLYYGRVFKGDAYDETPLHTFNTTYQVLDGNRVPYEFLDEPVDIGMLVKGRHLETHHLGAGLVRDISWKYRSIVVAVKSQYKTVNRALKKNAIPVTLGRIEEYHVVRTQTHYVNSITYGGYAYVYLQLFCLNPDDVRTVRKIVTKELGHEGAFTEETTKKWDNIMAAIKADKTIRDRVVYRPQITITDLNQGIGSSPEKILQDINRLPKTVGALGIALEMELRPLHDIDAKYRIVKYHPELISPLKTIDEMYDDVQIAMEKIDEIYDQYIDQLTDDEEKDQKINDLYTILKESDRQFFLITYDVSLFKEIKNETIYGAMEQYRQGLEPGVASYYLTAKRMGEDLVSCKNEFLYKIEGLLKVNDQEVQKKSKVEGGLEECQKLCLAESRCRSVGYSEQDKQCWIYFRSTGTATLYTPTNVSGDVFVYDRKCK